MTKLLFSNDTDSGSISVLDLDQAEPTLRGTIEVGNGPRGAVKFVADRGFVANHAGDTLSEIDPLGLGETRRIKVGPSPIGVGIVPGGRFIITSNAGDDSVSIVDISTNSEVGRVRVGREPRHPSVSPDGKFAYIPCSRDHYISKIDLTPLAGERPDPSAVSEIAKIQVGEGSFPYSAAISPNGRFALAANNQQSYISLIDAETDTVVNNIDVGTKGARGAVYASGSDVAFVSLENTSEVLAIKIPDGTIMKRMPSGAGPRGLALDEDTATLFASAFDRTTTARVGNSISVFRFNRVAAFALEGDQPQVTSVPVGAGPCSVSIFRSE